MMYSLTWELWEPQSFHVETTSIEWNDKWSTQDVLPKFRKEIYMTKM